MEGDDKVITDEEEAYKRIVKILNEKFGGIKNEEKTFNCNTQCIC